MPHAEHGLTRAHNPFCTSFNAKRTKDRHLTPWLENKEKLNDTNVLSDLPVPLNIGIVQYELEFRYLDRV